MHCPGIESSTKAISSFIGVFVKGWNAYIQPVIEKKIGQFLRDIVGKAHFAIHPEDFGHGRKLPKLSQVINAYKPSCAFSLNY